MEMGAFDKQTCLDEGFSKHIPTHVSMKSYYGM